MRQTIKKYLRPQPLNSRVPVHKWRLILFILYQFFFRLFYFFFNIWW
jgi:hypothetical protein